MLSPGANRSTVAAPKFEKEARASLGSDAPTQITLGSSYAHGYMAVTSLFAFSLPAAATNSVFGCARIAARSYNDDWGEPNEALTTRTPLVPAWSNAATTSTRYPLPDASSTRSGMTRASGATPTTPTPFSPAAIVPVTCVPWPFSSLGSESSPTKSYPGTRRPARSGCPRSAPVSTTATVTPAPRVTVHASGASMSASSVPCSQLRGPVFSSPQR